MASVPSAQRIREALENDIVEGRLGPGQQIDPIALERRFGCSRTPVREALQALESSGMVKVAAKRGTFVSEFDVIELTERFEMMAALEATCARLATRRATPEDLARVEAAYHACEEALKSGDADRYYEENRMFHIAIYEASGNGYLAAEALRLHSMLQPYRRRQLRSLGRMNASSAEHRRVVEALRAGREDDAAEAMFGHVVIQGERFNDLVAFTRRAARGR